jgi:hypothetical protein
MFNYSIVLENICLSEYSILASSIVHPNEFNSFPGKVVEYDNPKKLMETEGSLFRELVKEYWSYTWNEII